MEAWAQGLAKRPATSLVFEAGDSVQRRLAEPGGGRRRRSRL
jgi:hypothetical protein